MNLDSFTGPGSTPSRRRFWDQVTQVVNASQKIAGDNVTVDEQEGMGTLINAPNPTRRPTGTTGACCIDGTCTVTTEAVCSESGGVFLGTGTPCDPNPCVCPDPDAPTILLTYAGVEQCFPDVTAYPPDPFPNGTFTLENTGSGQWAIAVTWCHNPDTDEWTHPSGDTCDDGLDTFQITYTVTCFDSTLSVADFALNFFLGTGSSPQVSNTQDCPSAFGGGGTATIT